MQLQYINVSMFGNFPKMCVEVCSSLKLKLNAIFLSFFLLLIMNLSVYILSKFFFSEWMGCVLASTVGVIGVVNSTRVRGEINLFVCCTRRKETI